MILPVNDKYRIASDSKQWIVQTPVKISKKYPDGWQSTSYYVSLPQLVNALCDRMLRESNAVGVAEGLEEVKRILRMLTHALAPHYEVTKREDDA